MPKIHCVMYVTKTHIPAGHSLATSRFGARNNAPPTCLLTTLTVTFSLFDAPPPRKGGTGSAFYNIAFRKE